MLIAQKIMDSKLKNETAALKFKSAVNALMEFSEAFDLRELLQTFEIEKSSATNACVLISLKAKHRWLTLKSCLASPLGTMENPSLTVP